MLSLIITLSVVLAILLGMLFGFLRGFKNSLIRLASVVLASGLAFVFSLLVSKLLAGGDLMVNLMSIFGLADIYNELAAVSPTLAAIISALPVALITPVIFLLLFWLFKYLLLIPCAILYKKFDWKSKENIKERLIGLPLGAVQGLVSVLILLFVIGGYFNLVDQVIYVAMDSNNEEIVSEMKEISDFADEAKDNFIIDLTCKGDPNNFVFEGLSKFEFQNEKYSLTRETVHLSEAIIELAPMLNNNSTGISNEKIITTERFADKMEKSILLKAIGTDIMSKGGEKWSADESFLGLSFVGIDKNIYPVMIATFDVMEGTTTKTVQSDFDVLINMLKVLDKYDILNSSDTGEEKIMSLLKSEFSAELTGVLSGKERFAPVIAEIKNLSINILASSLKEPDISEEQYEEITDNIADALNEAKGFEDPDEGKQWLSDKVHEVITSGGVEIDQSIADLTSEAINEAFAEHIGEITKETIQEYFDKYNIQK